MRDGHAARRDPRREDRQGPGGGSAAGEAPRVGPIGDAEDEVALVLAARGGDRGAFGMLYQRYGRMVHGVLLARVPRGQVEDLVQDVFLTALRRLESLRD